MNSRQKTSDLHQMVLAYSQNALQATELAQAIEGDCLAIDAACNDGQWQQAIEIQMTRQQRLALIFSEFKQCFDAEQLASWVKRIVASDQQVIAVARDAQRKILSMSVKEQQNMQSIHGAYLER